MSSAVHYGYNLQHQHHLIDPLVANTNSVYMNTGQTGVDVNQMTNQQQQNHLLHQMPYQFYQQDSLLFPVGEHQQQSVMTPPPPSGGVKQTLLSSSNDTSPTTISSKSKLMNSSSNGSWTCPRLKEKSKNAARTRREKENMEFYELAKLLPLPVVVTSQLDKASIIRLTTSYLKIRKLFPDVHEQNWMNNLDQSLAVNMFQSLIGFVFILSPQGKMIYVSETASSILGLSQVEMTGNDLSDYIHPDDQEEIKDLLTVKTEEINMLNLLANISPKASNGQQNEKVSHTTTSTSSSTSISSDASLEREFMIERRFFLRIKCVLAKRNAGITLSGYKVIHCTGNIKVKFSVIDSGYPCLQNLGLMSIANVMPVPNPNSSHLRLDQDMFMLRASLELRIIYLESVVLQMTGYHPQDLVEKTLYHLVHPDDSQSLREDHLTLLAKGQVTTKYYRLLTKNGGHLWMQSQITIIHNSRSSRPNCVIGINYILNSKTSDNSMDSHKTSSKAKESSVIKTATKVQQEFLDYYNHIFENRSKIEMNSQEVEEKDMQNALPSEIHDYFTNSKNLWSQELSFINSQYNTSTTPNSSDNLTFDEQAQQTAQQQPPQQGPLNAYESFHPYTSNNSSTTSDSSSLNSSKMSSQNPNINLTATFNQHLSSDSIDEYSSYHMSQPPPYKIACTTERIPVISLNGNRTNDFDLCEAINSSYILTNHHHAHMNGDTRSQLHETFAIYDTVDSGEMRESSSDLPHIPCHQQTFQLADDVWKDL